MQRNINSCGRNGDLPKVVQENLVNRVKQQDERLLGVKRKTIPAVSTHNSKGKQFAAQIQPQTENGC
jgi:hypothetical protein